jgi:hypothetical protein
MNSAPDACRHASIKISRRRPRSTGLRAAPARVTSSEFKLRREFKELEAEAVVGSHGQSRLRRTVEAAT